MIDRPLNYQNKVAALREEHRLVGNAALLELLAAELGGTFQKGGLFLKDPQLQLTVGRWPMAVYYNGGGDFPVTTHVRAAFVSRDEFQFQSKSYGWLSRLLGAQLFKTRNPAIDERLLISGEPRRQLRALFTDSLVQSTLCPLLRDDVHFFCSPGISDHRGELRLRLQDRVQYADRMRELLLFCTAMLDRLVAIGSAAAPPEAQQNLSNQEPPKA